MHLFPNLVFYRWGYLKKDYFIFILFFTGKRDSQNYCRRGCVFSWSQNTVNKRLLYLHDIAKPHCRNPPITKLRYYEVFCLSKAPADVDHTNCDLDSLVRFFAKRPHLVGQQRLLVIGWFIHQEFRIGFGYPKIPSSVRLNFLPTASRTKKLAEQ